MRNSYWSRATHNRSVCLTCTILKKSNSRQQRWVRPFFLTILIVQIPNLFHPSVYSNVLTNHILFSLLSLNLAFPLPNKTPTLKQETKKKDVINKVMRTEWLQFQHCNSPKRQITSNGFNENQIFPCGPNHCFTMVSIEKCFENQIFPQSLRKNEQYCQDRASGWSSKRDFEK